MTEFYLESMTHVDVKVESWVQGRQIEGQGGTYTMNWDL